MDAQTLAEVIGHSLSVARYQELIPTYEKARRWANIDTADRAAMFAAQLGHESVGLLYQEEIASGSAYEGRTDLGNIYPGDDVKFKGHGWIQVTGRHNHTAVSQWAHARGIIPTATYFVDNPAELGRDQYCWGGPVWYWTDTRPNLKVASDQRFGRSSTNPSLITLTRRVRRKRAENCGVHFLRICKKLPILPTMGVDIHARQVHLRTS